MSIHSILAARLKGRLDAMIERDGSEAAAITGRGVGIGYLFARELLRALEAADALRAENERMREALTPNAETKGAYIGEFAFQQVIMNAAGEEEAIKVYVPWPTIKEIMAAIRTRAALTPKGE